MPKTVITSPVQVQKHAGQVEEPRQSMLLWHKIALGVILAIAAFFNFFALDKQDFYEYYYAAAVKSMQLNWHNMLFAAFDPGGFLAIDKPPLGFWTQALSTRIFGYSVFSIALPGALAGVLTVAVMFHLVRRTFGPLAGLLAALVLALSPINVVTDRNNIVDGVLILVVLLATWMMSKATETGRLRWLCLCAVLLGLGFNIKYLQAYMVIPALVLVYWLGAPLTKRKKIFHLALAMGVLLLISLCWVTIVDLTPPNQRPIIDSITSDSELDLAFGYNGAFRLNADNNVINYWAWEIGRPGIARFFIQPMAGQCGWLLPLALVSFFAWSRTRRKRQAYNRQDQAFVLWGSWLSIMLIFFSAAHFFHLYYLSMLTPAIAALVGAGIALLWQAYCRYGWHGWLLPYTLLATGIIQALFLIAYPMWSTMLAIAIAALSTALVLVRGQRFSSTKTRQQLHRQDARAKKAHVATRQHAANSDISHPIVEQHWQHITMFITAIGLLSLLLAPTAWITLALNPGGRVLPIAGPLLPKTRVSPLIADPVLEKYLLAHKGQAKFLLGTMNTEVASPFIIDTEQPVMALGGYGGNKSFLTRDQLIQRVDHGQIRFFLMPGSKDPTANWILSNCHRVPDKQWQSPNTTKYSVDGLWLYDCKGHA
ncbi:ArnT family glycosyltransferase [Dictyobacter aurantiacus]|uniref:Uncharacterized protein n=1 Tax=Dictyobacter aurantiacus TaxID=1936993 RepID=A0A401ZD85_9CHLR|nr:glycosyltransferase family 39 protein [Dictyobacter aurantiacus]GCE04803.1 hypothetical protein KDAU_21320 [Dictyobacter aurantiacus]